jgi:hypothetical protein
VASNVPLSALLSQALIAFTLEFDHEFGARCKIGGPSASTLAMWSNVMRFLGEEEVDERQLPGVSGVSKGTIHSMVACLERHGWVVVETEPADIQTKLIRLTRKGRKFRTCGDLSLGLSSSAGKLGSAGTRSRSSGVPWRRW